MFKKIEDEVCEWLTFYQYIHKQALCSHCIVATRLES